MGPRHKGGDALLFGVQIHPPSSQGEGVEIVWFSTLSLGTMNDNTIAVNELRGPAVERFAWERTVADGAYESLENCDIPHRMQYVGTRNGRPEYAELSPSQEEENNLFAHARARVEHVNSFCVYSHALFHGRPFIGTFENLHAYIGITVHTTALIIRREKSRQVPGFGNWPHFSPFA